MAASWLNSPERAAASEKLGSRTPVDFALSAEKREREREKIKETANKLRRKDIRNKRAYQRTLRISLFVAIPWTYHTLTPSPSRSSSATFEKGVVFSACKEGSKLQGHLTQQTTLRNTLKTEKRWFNISVHCKSPSSRTS